MSLSKKVAALVAGAVIVVGVHGLALAQGASPDDVAKFLAGMSPSAGSPIAGLTRSPRWQRHAKWFESNWDTLDKRQLSRIRAWSDRHLKDRQNTLYYMFSGPDFLYANAFYPHAKTYVLSGLEPVGAVPDLTTLRGAIPSELAKLRGSLTTILSASFFITKQMKSDLRSGRVNGTLPILYVFLARSGYAVREVTPVKLDNEGKLMDGDAGRSSAPGIKIVFAGSDGEARTLYYFNTDLSNGGVKNSGFLKFCETLAPGDSFVKSASYLLHSGNFSTVRDFLLEHSAVMVQDDSGIPLRYYDPKKWEFHPFGRYLAPLGIFPGTHQREYVELFKKARPIDFGIGYRHRPNESNLLLAVKKPREASRRVAPER
jgi:hypothetical protein